MKRVIIYPGFLVSSECGEFITVNGKGMIVLFKVTAVRHLLSHPQQMSLFTLVWLNDRWKPLGHLRHWGSEMSFHAKLTSGCWSSVAYDAVTFNFWETNFTDTAKDTQRLMRPQRIQSIYIIQQAVEWLIPARLWGYARSHTWTWPMHRLIEHIHSPRIRFSHIRHRWSLCHVNLGEIHPRWGGGIIKIL